MNLIIYQFGDEFDYYLNILLLKFVKWLAYIEIVTYG